MKVKQLIKELQKCDQDADVILSSDSEGNSYQVMSSAKYSISRDVRYVNEEYAVVILDEDELETEEDKAQFETAKKAIILYP